MFTAQSELTVQLARLTLTPRLIDVLALLLQGKSNKVIARDLSLSPETIKEYVATILHRLGVSSRAQVPMVVHSYFEPLLAWDSARRQHTLAGSSIALSSIQHALTSLIGRPERRGTQVLDVSTRGDQATMQSSSVAEMRRPAKS